MRNMKYVLNNETDEFVIIPDTMHHSDVRGDWTNAGFIRFTTDEKDECGNIIIKPICWGESVSLQLKSREDEDAAIIYRGMKDRW